MKQKLSITMDKETVKKLQTLLCDGRYRNQSHIIEFAVKEFLRGKR